MPDPRAVIGRYEITETLGKGGMGVVYKAYDTVVKREVALKTILDIADQKALELFHKEYEVLAAVSHPNIIEIFDLGDFEKEGERIPYFVMPLLNGMTLDRLIRTSSHRLTVERSVEIISQTCRGLQAAHERGLVHRDMKPSNIFVMEDDSVKIIDFGVVHKTDALSTKGLKGTLQYMAPELIQMKPPSALSDIFSLGVVAYETLTQRRPFERPSQHEIIQAVLHHIPPPASDLNSAVSQTVSQVVHKAMAKQPYHRFSSVRELAETLQKALRGETIEFFDPSRIQPRLQRATKAFEQGDYQFADEILTELEAEGHIDPAISLLRRQLDQAVRQKRILQLLESARTRFEEEEYPLALQKVQQVLEVEPENAAARALQANIETKRTEGKIEDWFRLARQHIDNYAYSHAREALQNVLQLKPKDTRARQMLAEVNHLEEEYLVLRQEKEQLYQAALQAWQSGEVSSALLKLERALELDRRAPDTSAPERSATYESFYKQVRSEHDAMNNSYAEARKRLADRDFVKAHAVCDEWLAKYPGHALFQALKFDVEEQQRQELSAYIAEIDRRVEAEADLDKRVHILKEALERYPGEAHFERSLRIMREKRDLVSSLVAKAQLFEERGQFTEALGQWEILQTIYSQYPGLNFEIDRVVKRRVQQARSEAKARLVAQVDRFLHSNNFAGALDLLQKSQAEFPDDAELAGLEKLARQGIERTAEAQRLFAQGQELCAQRRYAESVEVLRKARQLDEANSAIRSALVDTLVEQANAVLEKDWRTAEELLLQALDLDPSHALGKSLRTLALDRKRDEFVNQCVSQARQLQAAGDLEGAMKQVEQGLPSYPNEPRFSQLRSTLERELQETRRRQARHRDLEELGRLDRDAEQATVPEALKSIAERAQAIARQYSDDPEFRSLAAGIEQRVAALMASLEEAARRTAEEQPVVAPPLATPEEKPVVPPLAPAEAGQETLVMRGAPLVPKVPPPAAKQPEAERPPKAPARKPAPARGVGPPTLEEIMEEGTLRFRAGSALLKPPAPPVKPPAAERPAARPARETGPRALEAVETPAPEAGALAEGEVPPKKAARRILAGSIGLAALVLIVAGILAVLRFRRSTTAVPGVPLEVRTSPLGATIRINDKVHGTSNLRVDLPPGTYALQALKDGYEPTATTVTVKLGAPASIDLTLQPLAQALRLYTDLEGGKVLLDGNGIGELQEGQFVFEKVAPGSHTLEISSRHSEAKIAFETRPGSAPELSGPVAVKELAAVLVSSLGSRARVHCSFGPIKVSLDGQPAGEAGPDGLELNKLVHGAHELVLGEGKDQRKIVIEVGAAPALTAFLNSDRNVGALVVVTGEDDVRVLIDSKEYRHRTQRGQLRIPNLDVKGYSIQVSKQGYQQVAQQRVEIRKGEETKIEFRLVPIPTVASLLIQGALPGAQVILDRNPLGTVPSDGAFSASNLSPGEHTVEVRKEHYKTKRITKNFAAGEAVQLTATEVALEAALGILQLNLSPPDSQVTLTRSGEAQPRPVSETTLNLPEGSYTLMARAPNCSPRSVTVQVVAGETRAVDLRLSREKKVGMDDWENPDSWSREGNWSVRRGGDFALFRITPTSGRFVFTAMLRKGRRLQWVINHTDARNYALFQMDKKFFYRNQVRNGVIIELEKIPLKGSQKNYFTLQIKVAPHSVVHEAYDGKQWIPLDSWNVASLNFVEGKFGFLVPSGDEVAVSNFTFYPD